MSRLNPDGILILETGIAPGNDEIMAEVTRAIDKRFFPTIKKLRAMLSSYAYREIGESASQAGDPAPRYVFHVFNKYPVAILLLDNPYSGKTFVANTVFKDSITRISGDAVYRQIMQNDIDAPEQIKKIIMDNSGVGHIECAPVTSLICENNLLSQLCDALYQGKDDFVLDMWIPAGFREKMCELWDRKGFFVINSSIYRAGARSASRRNLSHDENCARYMEFLSKNFLINEDDYLAANPDVSEAIKNGQMPGAQFHYWHFGRKEGRKTKPD